MSAWQPIETAPDDTAILVYLTGAAQGLEIEIAHRSSDDPDGDWYVATHDGPPIDVPPTHWMPLPLAPEAA